MIKANNLIKALKKLTDEVEALTIDIIALDTGALPEMKRRRRKN